MEIPYTVKPRPDTGLPNPKIGIWLFLASEVMLFGGLFSAYIFLRLGADYPWPFHDLVVPPGLFNTANLIISSVTVVMAWASLKMRKYGAYKIYMSITLLCAVIFMAIKFFEYKGKFEHYGVTFKDGSVVEGHVGHHKQGDKIVFGEGKTLSFHLDHSDLRILDHLAVKNPAFDAQSHAADNHLYHALHESKPVKVRYTPKKMPFEGVANYDAKTGKFKVPYKDWKDDVSQEAELTEAWLKERKKEWWNFYKLGNKLDRTGREERWAKVAAGTMTKEEAQKADSDFTLERLPDTIRVEIIGEPLLLWVDERELSGYDNASLTFRDHSKVEGALVTDKIEFIPDRVDLRQAKNMEKSTVWKYMPGLKDEFFKSRKDTITRLKEDKPWLFHGDKAIDPDDHSVSHGDGDVTRYSDRYDHEDNLKFGDLEHTPSIEFDRADKRFFSNFTPRYSPYYAIYFTMTGLHGLHVIGGALVLGWFLFTGRKMYETNPEQLCNRVEVGGLFWHFVDLIWIFLFPVFYLM